MAKGPSFQCVCLSWLFDGSLVIKQRKKLHHLQSFLWKFCCPVTARPEQALGGDTKAKSLIKLPGRLPGQGLCPQGEELELRPVPPASPNLRVSAQL